MEITETTSFPGAVAPMLKWRRSALMVASVRARVRETVRCRLGSAAEMWILVLGVAWEWVVSVGGGLSVWRSIDGMGSWGRVGIAWSRGCV